MEITHESIPVRDIVDGYRNLEEEGVVGYGGNLNIRPPYQREFVYNDDQRNSVINTVKNGFPLNIMYWAKTGDDTYEVLDGQQRTLSICGYVDGRFTVDNRFFHNLTDEEKSQILDYELSIYKCEGTDSEKLEWFKIVNIAGEELTDQEIRNAVYAGSWLEDAKRYFSKSNAVARDLAGGLMSGNPLRQVYLETALKWIADRDEVVLEEYMARNQHAENASELWEYFTSVIEWVRSVFPVERKREMQNIEWGYLYNQYHENEYDADEMEATVSSLMRDYDVSKKSGIYHYVFDGRTKHLNIRTFNDRQKREAYERQDGLCNICGEEFVIEEMEGDHITPWSEGGQTVPENCQMICVECNRRKSTT